VAEKVCPGERDLRYSRAYSSDTAPIILGVQASNFSFVVWSSNPSQETSFIVPPQTLSG
jgi:hypothetical protein